MHKVAGRHLDQHMLRKVVVPHLLLVGLLLVPVGPVYEVALHSHLVPQLRPDFLVSHWLELFFQNLFLVINELHVQLKSIYRGSELEFKSLTFCDNFSAPSDDFSGKSTNGLTSSTRGKCTDPCSNSSSQSRTYDCANDCSTSSASDTTDNSSCYFSSTFLDISKMSDGGNHNENFQCSKNEIQSFNNFINLFDCSFFLCFRLIFTHFKIQKWFNSKTNCV